MRTEDMSRQELEALRSDEAMEELSRRRAEWEQVNRLVGGGVSFTAALRRVARLRDE